VGQREDFRKESCADGGETVAARGLTVWDKV